MEVAGGCERQSPRRRLGADRRSQRVRRLLLGRRGGGQQVVGRFHDPRMAGREGAGLVEDHDRRRAEQLERCAALDHDAAPSRARQTRHECDGSGQDQWARRCDDQHGERSDGRAGDDPAERGDGEGDGQEHDGGAICETRRARPVRLGAFDEAHDARIRRGLGLAQGANFDRLADDTRPAANLVAPLAAHRQRLAREGRLVEDRAPARQRAIDGNDLTCEDEQVVAGDDLRGRHVHRARGPAQVRHGRRTRRERGELAPGTAEGPLVEQLASGEHQRDDEACEQLAQEERTHHRQQRDHVGSQLTVQHAACHCNRKRPDHRDQREGPDDIGGPCFAGSGQHEAGDERQRDGGRDEQASHLPIVGRGARSRIGGYAATRRYEPAVRPRGSRRNPQPDCARPPMAAGRGVPTVTENKRRQIVNSVENRPILLCYDGSPGSEHALETAGALFPGHTAVVLHVWSPIALIVSRYGGMATMPTYDDSELQQAAMELAGRGARAAAAAGLSATAEACETTYAGTAHDILAAADRHDAALIAVGARGLSTFKAMVLGSVSHGVAQHARRPVLIVPPATRDELTAAPAERTHASV